MNAFFDIEYYDDDENTKDKKIARITAIKIDNNKRIVFDKRTDCSNMPAFYTNMLDIPDMVEISENILEDFYNFIGDSDCVYYYGCQDAIKRFKIKEKFDHLNLELIDFENEIINLLGGGDSKKTNQKLISNSLGISFPFYENHNSIFEVNNFVDIFQKIKSNNYDKKLFIERYKELLEAPEILWNYQKFKIEKNDNYEYDKNKKYEKHIINDYIKDNEIIIIDNKTINHEHGNIKEILKDNPKNIIFVSSISNKKLKSSTKKILYNTKDKYTYYKKVN